MAETLTAEQQANAICDGRISNIIKYRGEVGLVRELKSMIAAHIRAAAVKGSERMRTTCEAIAAANDSGRGNENEIARAIAALPLEDKP